MDFFSGTFWVLVALVLFGFIKTQFVKQKKVRQIRDFESNLLRQFWDLEDRCSKTEKNALQIYKTDDYASQLKIDLGEVEKFHRRNLSKRDALARAVHLHFESTSRRVFDSELHRTLSSLKRTSNYVSQVKERIESLEKLESKISRAPIPKSKAAPTAKAPAIKPKVSKARPASLFEGRCNICGSTPCRGKWDCFNAD